MLVSFLLALRSLPDLVPWTVLLATAPSFLIAWMPLRIVGAVLPRKTFGSADDYTWEMYQRFVLFFFEKLCPVQVLFHGDIDDMLRKKESVLYISNHQSTVDWIVADMLAARQGSLGHMRFILKDGLRFLPFYGYYFYQHDCLYVRRSRKFNVDLFQKNLRAIPNRRNRTWLIVFPEGTRYNPLNTEATALSQAYARENELTPLHNVLSPRNKAFHLSQITLKAYFDAVYDVTIIYSQTFGRNSNGGTERLVAPSMNDYMHGTGHRVHIILKRFPIQELPQQESETAEWLHARFLEKDRILTDYYHENKLPDAGRTIPLKWSSVLPATIFFVSLNSLLWGTETGRKMYLASLLGFGGLTVAYMGVRKVA